MPVCPSPPPFVPYFPSDPSRVRGLFERIWGACNRPRPLQFQTPAAKCDNCVTNVLQICDIVVLLRYEHRVCGRTIGAVLAFDGRHRRRFWRQYLVNAQAALARQVAIALKQQPRGRFERAATPLQTVLDGPWLFAWVPMATSHSPL